MVRRDETLSVYNTKRDFSKTPEPRGAAGKGTGNSFVVQKHEARRLHFDFRLEIGGVLKSWAVTRGPSLNPDDKRLAVRTEDHPLNYGGFEGVIPKGEYGGGTVMLWDRGRWEAAAGTDPSETLREGRLRFTLFGERMRGEWVLVRMAGEKRENWLLRKVDDSYAGGSDDLVETCLTSVSSGRTMAEIMQNAPKTKKNDAPTFRPVQLATLVDAVPDGPDWLHEIKFDGYRCLLATNGDTARIFTRSGLDWTDRFPSIAAAAKTLALPATLIDGEIVVMGRDGNPSFSALQKALKTGDGTFTMFAFDMLSLAGRDLTGLPTLTRKEQLAALIPEDGPIRAAPYILGSGDRLYAEMCRAGQEGIVSKKADAPYRGRRTRNWLKVKCGRRQEFIIVGWLPSTAKGRSFRSLLLAQMVGGALAYAGKVGTGFDADTQDALMQTLTRLARKTAPLEVPAAERRGARWVTPKLVAEIAYAEFTDEGRIRHASFLGLRDDKPAKEVTPETADTPRAAAGTTTTTGPLPKITHPERILIPDAKLTKQGLADYYAEMGALMLPWVSRRPVSLVRCPDGIEKPCFFQKHGDSFGEAVHGVTIREKSGKTGDYLYVETVAGLVACVQMGTIEFHGWGAGIDDIERPDRLIFDLDPDEGLDFAEVKQAARDIRAQLQTIGLKSFPMLSGGKGIHVVVPLTPEARWPAVKGFAERFSRAFAELEPERFTATLSKAKRKGRIFIDWLRNQRGSTAILPYSVRARPGAPVAAPVTWAELDGIAKPGTFRVKDRAALQKRAASRALSGWGVAAQTLPDV